MRPPRIELGLRVPETLVISLSLRAREEIFYHPSGIQSTWDCSVILVISAISLWMMPLDAKVWLPQIEKRLPEKSLSMPPASVTIKEPAAVSHGLSLSSQKPSMRPQAR